MSDDVTDLARRAVACKHWRWMEGMVGAYDCYHVEGGRASFHIVRVGHRGLGAWAAWDAVTSLDYFIETRSTALPDLTSPATIGCLLALVREAWGDPRATTMHAWAGVGIPEWSVSFQERTAFVKSSGWQFSEVDALINALESAP